MAVALVQSNATNNSSAATSHGNAYGSNVTSGNTLVAFVTYGSNTTTCSSITDTLGNTWSLVERRAHTSDASTVECWKSEGISSGGANTVTFNHSTSTTSQTRLFEVSGSSTVVEDQSIGFDETSTTSFQDATGITNTKTDSITIMGTRHTSAYTDTAATYSNLYADNRNWFQYEINSSATSENPSTTYNANESGANVLVSFGYGSATPTTITLSPIVVRPSFVTTRVYSSRPPTQITQMHHGVSGRQYGSFAKSGGDITITLSAIAVDATIVAPTVTTGVNLRLSPLTTTATLVAPTASAAVIVTTSPISATATIVAPTITVGTNIRLSPLSVPATLVAPTVQTGKIITLSPLSVAATLVAPTVVVAQQVTLSPVSVTATIVAPTISWGNTVTLSPIPVQATVVAPAVSGAVTVTLSPLEVDATLVAPTVSTGVVVTLSPLTVQGTLVAPTITTGQTVVLSPLVVGATLVAPTARLDVSVALSAMVVEATLAAPRVRVISGIITVPVGSTPTRLGPYGSSATRIGLASGSATKIGPSRSTSARP